MSQISTIILFILLKILFKYHRNGKVFLKLENIKLEN